MSSIPLPDINMAQFVIGSVFALDLSAVTSQLPFAQTDKPAYIRLYNNSGDLLRYRTTGGASDTVPPGAWPLIPIYASDTNFSLTVVDVVGNASLWVLSSTFYPPGENVPDLPVQGNAPTGQSRVIAIPSMPHNTVQISNSFTGVGGGLQLLSIITGIPNDGQPHAYQVYFYNILLDLFGARWADVRLWLAAFNASGSAFFNGSTLLYRTTLHAGEVWEAPELLQAELTVTAIGVLNSLVLALQTVAAYPTSGVFTVTGASALDIDFTGTLPPPGIGNGGQMLPGVTY